MLIYILYMGLFPFWKVQRNWFSKTLKLQKYLQWVPHHKHKIKRKKKIDEGADDTSNVSQSTEKSFRISCFIPIVDQPIASLTRRFEQYQGYEKTFSFLFTSDSLQSMDDNKSEVRAACVNLEDALKGGEHKDIDGQDLFRGLLFIQNLL